MFYNSGVGVDQPADQIGLLPRSPPALVALARTPPDWLDYERLA
jgi:hypothetical protein